MSLSKTYQLTQYETGISKHVPITHLNSPTIFETSNGMLAMVMKIEGMTFTVASHATLNQHVLALHRAITYLNDCYAIYVTTHRHHHNMQLNGTFDNAFSTDLDKKYHHQFKNSAMYINDIYLTVIYKGLSSGTMGKGLNFISKLTNQAIKNAREIVRQEQIKSLTQTTQQLFIMLSAFNPRIIGERDNELGYSELLSFLSMMLNGGASLKTPYPTSFSSISKTMVAAKTALSLYPYGNIAQFISTKRIFFGEYIQFHGASHTDSIFGTMISIKRYGQESTSTILDKLLHLDSDFISTHSYAVEAKDITLTHIKKHICRMRNVNDPAMSQINALHEASDILASDQINMGYHHNTVMLLASSPTTLEEKIANCIQCYTEAGFAAIRETLGQEPAFWAQIPTNFKYIARSSLITSANFADFSSLHNYCTGYSDENHLGHAVTILTTPAKTPYRFNFHVRGSKHNPSKGHTIIIGGNGCGKTVMMTFMDAQLGRYHGHTFYFDRDRGAEIYLRATHGTYVILSPNHQDDTHFAPLQLKDTPVNRQFNRDLLLQFCKETEHDTLSADVIEQLTCCINYAYDHLAPQHRTFSNAVKILPISFTKWPSLKRWLRADTNAREGEYAYVFDNHDDQLSIQKKIGFDITHFIDHEPAHIRLPLMMYLFHRIHLTLEEKHHASMLTSIFLDEGWQYLSDPYWEQQLKRILPTWRKHNAHLIIATQSPASIAHSSLRHVIMDNIATQIYFANPQATISDYLEGLKLTPTEYAMICNNPPESRLFLVKQEHHAAVCQLNLSHMPEMLMVLSANATTIQLLTRLRQTVGDHPSQWLPLLQEYCLGKQQ